jgi:hypothetical protein
MIIHLRFYECEHQGDLNTYLQDVIASGGQVIDYQLDEDAEEAIAKIEVDDFSAFKAAFQKTSSADFCESLDWIEPPLRKMTRDEIEAAGAAMPETMKFHDQLTGAMISLIIYKRTGTDYSTILGLQFNDGAKIFAQFDDEGNPGDVEFAVADADGNMFQPEMIEEITGHSVVGAGYFREPSNDVRNVIPFVEFEGNFHICAMCSEGGAVIKHMRGETKDLLCQLRLPRS